MQATSYQLKYCERCGSLRVRPAHAAATYCPSCQHTLCAWKLPEQTVQLLLRWPNPAPSYAAEAELALAADELELVEGRLP